MFRQWANTILKEFLLRGYAVNHRIDAIEASLHRHDHLLEEHERKIDFFVRTSLPPIEGIFYDGQIFDAYVFVSNLIKSARKRLILIDNYVDEFQVSHNTLLLNNLRKMPAASVQQAFYINH